MKILEIIYFFIYCYYWFDALSMKLISKISFLFKPISTFIEEMANFVFIYFFNLTNFFSFLIYLIMNKFFFHLINWNFISYLILKIQSHKIFKTCKYKMLQLIISFIFFLWSLLGLINFYFSLNICTLCYLMHFN